MILTKRPASEGIAEWVLRQPRIVVHDAFIAWRDELAGAPDLSLNQVEVLLENRLGRHRFGLKGAPPDALAAPLDLRGDLTGGVAHRLARATGRLYARLDYADIAAWREWLPMTVPISSGKGALASGSRSPSGELRDFIADVVLTDVQARARQRSARASLARLEGRLGWHDDSAAKSSFASGVCCAEEKTASLRAHRFQADDA